jgi:hypothetical protein
LFLENSVLIATARTARAALITLGALPQGRVRFDLGWSGEKRHSHAGVARGADRSEDLGGDGKLPHVAPDVRVNTASLSPYEFYAPARHPFARRQQRQWSRDAVANAKDFLIAQHNLIEGDRQLIGADHTAASSASI